MTALWPTQALHDLRNPDDLALRQAAAQALERFVAAAASEANGDEPAAAGPAGPLVPLAQRLLFPQLKRGLPSPSLAVRQEHLALLRRLVLALPEQYAPLAPLATGRAAAAAAAAPGAQQPLAAQQAADGEADFLSNVAHLQLHRRARAFLRLARMLQAPTQADGAPGGAVPPPLGVGALVGVVLPLVQQAIVEGRGSAEEGAGGHEAKAGDVGKAANVTGALGVDRSPRQHLPLPLFAWQLPPSRWLPSPAQPNCSTAWGPPHAS